MKFRDRNLREIAELVVGDSGPFRYRSSSYITEFFDECGLAFVHDGSTRRAWTADRLAELLTDPQPTTNTLPDRFVHVLRVLMQKADAPDHDPEREEGIKALNRPLMREGFQAYFGDDEVLYIRHIRTSTLSNPASPHRAFTQVEMRQRAELAAYLDECSEDDLIERVLMPLLRQLGFQRITAAGHKDKALEYGKDIWMRFMLPTQHILYFGVQVKKGKLDAAGRSKGSNVNIAEIHDQVLMMLGHEVFDPDTSRRVLVDHAFIVAGGEITKAARNWLGGRLDATKRSQILFMDRDAILDQFVAARLPLPERNSGSFSLDDDIPF